MTTPDFQARHPKPWRFVVNEVSFALQDANGKPIGKMNLSSYHTGIPQREWNRHIAAALREYLTVEEPL